MRPAAVCVVGLAARATRQRQLEARAGTARPVTSASLCAASPRRCSMAPRLRSASALHNALPEEGLRLVMLALPVDARARAACVCRAWRAFLADVSLWQVLDLTAGGVDALRVTVNLVRGAVARAAGQLRVLSLNNVRALDTRNLLVHVVESDGAALQEVNTDLYLQVEHLQSLFAAAPLLQVLNAQVAGPSLTLLPVLRNDAPYGPLRASKLQISFQEASTEDMLACAAVAAAHESKLSRSLIFYGAGSPRGLNALVDAAAERRVSSLTISACAVDRDTAHALARLLQHGSLTELDIFCEGFPRAQEASMPVLCAALRSCRTLTRLKLRLSPYDRASIRTVTELLDAAAALPELSELDLCSGRVQDEVATGRAFGALLAANLPSLRILRLRDCRLGDRGLAPLLNGLAANTHLRELDCIRFNDLSAAFVRDRLAPAALAAGVNLPA